MDIGYTFLFDENLCVEIFNFMMVFKAQLDIFCFERELMEKLTYIHSLEFI